MIDLILGSNSPRRKEILEYFKLPFTQKVSHFDEESIPFEGDPALYVQTIASKKNEALPFPDSLILTADTTVYCSGKIYNKPLDLIDAKQMLQELSGNWHTVYTGVVLRKGKTIFQATESTRVLMNSWTPSQIENYLATHPWQDKAGSYTIQGSSGIIVNRIEGCYYNVLGLPINTLAKGLKQFGIDII